jgi:hypothetical protein
MVTEALWYDPAKLEAVGVTAEGEPLPSGKRDDDFPRCSFHNDRERPGGARMIQLTNWKDEPYVCGSCLLDLARDGFIAILPRSDLRELLDGTSADTTAELSTDGSVAMGNVVYAW